VIEGKGGPPGIIPGSVNVPLNHDGVGQRTRLTCLNEFLVKLSAEGVKLPRDKEAVIITHCGSGGRGGKAAALLRQAGYVNAHNGGGLLHISSAMSSRHSSRSLCDE
jgi:rhodanese-related sulfurtransferase